MGRSSSAEAYSRACRAWDLREQGLSYSAISQEIGISSARLSQIFKSSDPRDRVDPALVIEKARFLKQESRGELGPMQLRALLVQEFGSELGSDICSERSLGYATADLVVHSQTRCDSRDCFQENHPSTALHTFEFDTKALVFPDGRRVEVLTCTDIVSHAAWAERLTGAGSVTWALSRCFQALGVPRILQADNGFGWHNPSRTQLSNAAKFSFQSGVKRFHLVPQGEAWRNGHVERFNGSLGRKWSSDSKKGIDSFEEFDQWLNNWLLYYNTIKPHDMLNTRNEAGKRSFAKGSRRSPVQAGALYSHLPVVAADKKSYRNPVVTYSPDLHGGVFSYHRLVTTSGVLAVGAPIMMFKLQSSGHYARVDLHMSDGSGEVWADRRIVGTFTHSMSGHYQDSGDLIPLVYTGYVARSYQIDDQESEDFLARRLRHGKFGYLVPRPYEYDHSTGYVIDARTGEVVWTKDCVYGIDHLHEYLGESQYAA